MDKNKMDKNDIKNAKKKSKSLFVVSYAPTGRATCRECEKKIPKDSLRITRYIKHPSREDDFFQQHYHMHHGINVITRVRCESDDPILKGIGDVDKKDREEVRTLYDQTKQKRKNKCR